MNNTVIEVDSLSKFYNISHKSGGEVNADLRDIITRKAKRLFSYSGTTKQRTIYKNEKFWALKNISFKIEQGSKVGILGRNGAGKSTLLKVLSKIVHPSEGNMKVKGHVVSLLEIGTGFHPELTGRENIFLNGVILGMSRNEIRKKFDEIVSFAEIDQFLDTPVKKYSSGMYMRLAFSVAAHLEPEILIIDEVLAVGDTLFQNKCLAKMEEISRGEGRTVLYVSHQLDSLRSFCDSAIYLKKGELYMQGDIETVASAYVHDFIDKGDFKPNAHKPIYFESLKIIADCIVFNSMVQLSCIVFSDEDQASYIIGLTVSDSFGNKVGSTLIRNEISLTAGLNPFTLKVSLPDVVPGRYNFSVAIALDSTLNNEDVIWNYPEFTITQGFEANDFVLDKWHNSWGAHILSGTIIH